MLNQLASALPENVMPGWKEMIMKNTLAYYGTELITALKSIVVHALVILP